ncbi:hypothetical protein CRUP_027345, partial [Coryphaenoides rupestris]
MGCCSRRCGLLLGAAIGAAVAILGGILFPAGELIIQGTVEKEAVIEPGTTAYENWVSSAGVVYRQMWLFDVQNPQEVVDLGAAPVVQERGPYTYRVRYLPKQNITFNPLDYTVSFLLPNGAIFEPSMSVGGYFPRWKSSRDFLVVRWRLSSAGAYSMLPEEMHMFVENLIKKTHSSLFQRRPVGEILWGYPDPILGQTMGVFWPYNGTFDGFYTVFTGQDDISKVAMMAKSVSSNFVESLDLKGIEVYRYVLPPSAFASPAQNPDNQCFCNGDPVTRNCTLAGVLGRRTVGEILWGYPEPILNGAMLGVFSTYNGTFDGLYTVFTGQDDISKVAMMAKWQGKRQVELSFWGNKYCDALNGTDATSFAPFLDKNKPLYFFSSDICRSVSSNFAESLDLKGIEVYRYVLPPSTFASPAQNPDNQCFCNGDPVTRNCTLAGVLDVNVCHGAPVFISLPHFLHGSEHLTENVLGMNASEEHHFTYLDVEPITGFTLRFAKRLQMNMMYGPSKLITVLKKVKDYTIFPIVWLNETASLDAPTADRIKSELFGRMDAPGN